MSTPISWHVELRVRPDAMAAFRALTAEMVEAARAEPGCLIYERFIEADGVTVHALERYADAAAAVAHLRAFGVRFANRFVPLVERVRFEVFGEPGEELRELFDAIGVTYAEPFAAFDRY